MSELSTRPVRQVKRATCASSSALTVLVLLLFTSGVFAVAQTGYGPEACRVLVLDAQDGSLPRESQNWAAVASAESLEAVVPAPGARTIRRALRVLAGLPAPRAPGCDA